MSKAEYVSMLVNMLQTLCGADPYLTNEDSVSLWLESESREFRFSGSLGFGGKLRKPQFLSRSLWISAYPEDLYGNPERTKTLETAQTFLNGLGMPPLG